MFSFGNIKMATKCLYKEEGTIVLRLSLFDHLKYIKLCLHHILSQHPSILFYILFTCLQFCSGPLGDVE